MAAHQDGVAQPHDQSAAIVGDEKLGQANDLDSSSGNADALENGPLEEVDKIRERQILRKLDFRIVPMVMWCYLMNMMDRGKTSISQFTWNRINR